MSATLMSFTLRFLCSVTSSYESSVQLDGLVKGSRVLHLEEQAVGSTVSWRLPEGQMDNMFNRHEN